VTRRPSSWSFLAVGYVLQGAALAGAALLLSAAALVVLGLSRRST
jgi:hypothetical protein